MSTTGTATVVGFWATASVVPRSRPQVASGLAEADVEALRECAWCAEGVRRGAVG